MVRNVVSEKSLKNLIPFDKRSEEDQRRIRSMGGKTHKSDPKFILACKLREMKKKGMTNAAVKELYELMTNTDISSLDILLYLKAIKTQEMLPKEQIAMVKAMSEWHKLRHGSKDISQINVNLNTINLTVEQKEEKILHMIGDDEDNKKATRKIVKKKRKR